MWQGYLVTPPLPPLLSRESPPPPPFYTHPPSLQPSFERCQVSCLQRGSSSSFPLKRSVVQWWYTANIQHWVRVRSKQPPPLDRPKRVSCEQIPHLEIRRETYHYYAIYKEKNEAFTGSQQSQSRCFSWKEEEGTFAAAVGKSSKGQRGEEKGDNREEETKAIKLLSPLSVATS